MQMQSQASKARIHVAAAGVGYSELVPFPKRSPGQRNAPLRMTDFGGRFASVQAPAYQHLLDSKTVNPQL